MIMHTFDHHYILVERTARRHKNIHNEILMEKRALSKLDHPNIVTLYATFKDYGSLYYQMEYLEKGGMSLPRHYPYGDYTTNIIVITLILTYTLITLVIIIELWSMLKLKYTSDGSPLPPQITQTLEDGTQVTSDDPSVLYAQCGMPLSLIKFYLLEAINALEYMHR